MHRPALPVLIVLLSAGYVLSSDVFAQTPSVDRVETVNCKPVESATLAVYGKDLKTSRFLWTAFGQLPLTTSDPADYLKAVFGGLVPASVVPGIYEVRVVTANGVSARRFIVVDDLPSIAVTGDSESRPATVTLPDSCCMNGQLNPLKPKYFRLQLKANQKICIEALARRLDSSLDPVLRLMNSSGREVAFADDTPGLAGDVQLQYVADSDDAYTLELRDAKFGGGGNYHYHLRVGAFPVFRGTYPRRTASGALVSLIAESSDGQGVASLVTTVNDSTSLVVPVSFQSEQGSSLQSVALMAEAPIMESEPNNEMQSSNFVLESAAGIAGRFQTPGDVDWFRISAEAGQHLCFTAHTRDVGSAADVQLAIHDGLGKTLVQVDDVGNSDSQLSFKVLTTADYFLSVSEVSRQAGSVFTYDIELQRFGRLEVSTTIDSVAIPQGGSASIPLSVKRIGFSGAFRVVSADLPDGVECSAVQVGENQKNAVLCLHDAGGANLQYLNRILIQASSSPKDKPLAVLHESTVTGESNYQRHCLQTGVFIFPTAPSAYSLTPAASEITIAPGHEANVSIRATRTGDWNQPIDVTSAIAAAELPAGVTLSAAQIATDAADVLIKVDSKAKPGHYSLSLQGTLKKDKTNIVQPVPTITLIVANAPDDGS